MPSHFSLAFTNQSPSERLPAESKLYGALLRRPSLQISPAKQAAGLNHREPWSKSVTTMDDGVIHLKPCSGGRIGELPIENPELAFMADVLNPERTESTHLNTELQTPTLDAPADHFDPSDDLDHSPAR